jgi:hypothetical protein
MSRDATAGDSKNSIIYFMCVDKHSSLGRCCVALRLYLYTTGKVRGTFELACEVCVYSEREVLDYAMPFFNISLVRYL